MDGWAISGFCICMMDRVGPIHRLHAGKQSRMDGIMNGMHALYILHM
jgi:hypothetical protein